MTFLLDPHRDWEIDWERTNPEPHQKPTLATKDGGIGWRPFEIRERVAWHKKRWEAFKRAFPLWREGLSSGLLNEQ